MKFRQYLKSEDFVTWVALITVIVQATHSAFVFNAVSSLQTIIIPYLGQLAWYHSSIMSLTISGAILVFILRSNKPLAKFFAFFEAYINISYYCVWIWSLTGGFSANWGYLFIGVPISSALPYAIFGYANELDKNLSNDRDIIKEEVVKRIDEALDGNYILTAANGKKLDIKLTKNV